MEAFLISENSLAKINNICKIVGCYSLDTSAIIVMVLARMEINELEDIDVIASHLTKI